MVDVMEAIAFRKERVIWNHEMERELIELIRDRPYIWKTTDPDFIKRSLKTRGYEEVADIMRHMTQQFIDGDTVRQKFCGIRSYFQRELRKIRDSRENGLREEYHSKWEHFHSLQFLTNHIGAKKNSLTASEGGGGGCLNSMNGEIEENPEEGGGGGSASTSTEDMTIMVTPTDFNPDEPRASSPPLHHSPTLRTASQQQLQQQQHPQLTTTPAAAAAAAAAVVPPLLQQPSTSKPSSATRHSQRLALRLPVYKRKRLSEPPVRYASKPRDGADGYGDFVAGHMRRMTPQQQLICSNMINDCVRKVLSWTRPFDDVYYEINIKTDS